MFDDSLTDEQRVLRDAAREFCQRRVVPRAEQFDHDGAIPDDVFSEMAQLGYFGLRVPESYGGMDCDPIAYTLVIEEFARACAGLAITISVQNALVCGAIKNHGTEDQKKAWLPQLVDGALSAYALTEPGAGTDAGSLRASARRSGNEYILNGEKCFVTNASLAKFIVVFASTDLDAGSKGISAFVVASDTAGIGIGKPERKLGLRASDTRSISFCDARVPAGSRLGEEGAGYKIALSQLAHGRLGVAAQALGIGEAAFAAARQYARERKQFGRPIAEFQAIAFKLADMRIKLDASRLLLDRAVRLQAADKPFAREAAEAKVFASESANWVANEALQIHGGYGYMVEYPVERYFRDARVTTIYEGTSEAQRIVISRAILSQ